MTSHRRTAGLLLIGLVFTGCSAKQNWSYYGESMKLEQQRPVPVKKVLTHKEDYDGKMVRVAGKVDSVCVPRGCWMRISDEGLHETLFVKFTCPVEGRLIPLEAVGSDAVVEGTLTVTEISETEARHYHEDAGASPEEIARIVGPQKEITMRSAAAKVAVSRKES